MIIKGLLCCWMDVDISDFLANTNTDWSSQKEISSSCYCCGDPVLTTGKNETERNQWNTNTEIVEINHYYLVAHHQTTMGKHYLASTATNRRNAPTNTRNTGANIRFLNDTRTCSLNMFNAHTLSVLLNLDMFQMSKGHHLMTSLGVLQDMNYPINKLYIRLHMNAHTFLTLTNT